MIDVSFEINGRKVRSNQIGDALEKAAFESIKEQIIHKVGNIRDPRTGQRPKIRVKGRNLNKLSIEVSGSEEVIEAVNKALG